MAIDISIVVADASAEGVFPPFETTTFLSQLIWLAITFGVLYTLMARLIAPRLHGIIETREVTVARDLETAATAKKKAADAGEAYEKALAEAKAKAQALAQKTRDKLAAESDEKRTSLEADLAARLATAEKTIDARKREAMGNVRGIAEDTATAIVERLIGAAPPEGAVSAALDAAGER
ncbi:MAG: F0F1 ATP synthase subunit B' [Salinarimonadaceae bacterium]|nr:MAG: F0F1 ATP synthase subunit B' [Salinarimonadaceae bacterium]